MDNELIKKNHLILVILDGWGIAPPNQGNAITLAKTPFFDFLQKKYPFTKLCSYGHCAGLLKNQPGNSEAGHLNLGAGRIVKDDAVYISESIKNETFFKNPAFLESIKHLQENRQSKVHLIGLVTEKDSAHSCPEHWLAMIHFFEEQGIKQIFLHLFTDGRDSSQHAAVQILERFEQSIKNNHNHSVNQIEVKIASLVGRFYAMDRKKNWGNIEKAYHLLTMGDGLKAISGQEAIVQAYNRKETDEFISPTVVVGKNGEPIATINEKDVVVFMNLRSDRARELTKAFSQQDFNKKNPSSFKREKVFRDLFFITLTDFGPDLDKIRTAFPSKIIRETLPVVLGNLQQFYIAETEKYAHVTFFFNGGYDHPVANEERVLIDSPQVDHYDETPEMSTQKICQRVIKEIEKEKPDFIMINFCNPDMLGHTGNLQAAIKGIEFLDLKLKELVTKAQKENYFLIITADHGNAEEMIDLETKEVKTTHTLNPIPFILISQNHKIKLRNGGKLSDVAPTILDLMGLKKPGEMTGNSLIIE